LIYANAPPAAEAFGSDHSLPWSFFAHDQLWSQIPVPASANSAKPNLVPSDEHFHLFAGFRYDGPHIARQAPSARELVKFAGVYLAHLHLPSVGVLLDSGQPRNTRERSVEPLVTPAYSRDLTPNWVYPDA
jgi:hypothetical protein